MLLRKPLFYFSIALLCWLAGVVVPFALNPDKDEQIAMDATKRIEQALGESRREFNEFVAVDHWNISLVLYQPDTDFSVSVLR